MPAILAAQQPAVRLIKMKRFVKYIGLLLFCFCLGCASANLSNLPIKHPLPIDGITIRDNQILHDGDVFAELIFYFTAELSESPGEAYLFSSETQHRGLAIYYKTQEELVWIFPEEGRDEDVERGYFRARGQTDGYVGWVYDVSISEDGKYVYWKKPGLMSQSSYVYSVEHGVSKLIERDWN